MVSFVLSELGSLVLAQSQAFDPRVHDPSDCPETSDLVAVPFLRRTIHIWARSNSVSSGTAILQKGFTLVCVGLGASSSPTLWPEVWGRWGDAYTIRRFGGTCIGQPFASCASGGRGTKCSDRCEFLFNVQSSHKPNDL